MKGVKERHLKYFRAVSSPLRREILKALEDGELTMEVLKLRTNLDCKTLEWHLDILQQASCVEKESREGEIIYKITTQGRIIDRLE
jgi:DNA-binding transcriptional ArsR family regulator